MKYSLGLYRDGGLVCVMECPHCWALVTEQHYATHIDNCWSAFVTAAVKEHDGTQS